MKSYRDSSIYIPVDLHMVEIVEEIREVEASDTGHCAVEVWPYLEMAPVAVLAFAGRQPLPY